jgi:hypothetical protein
VSSGATPCPFQLSLATLESLSENLSIATVVLSSFQILALYLSTYYPGCSFARAPGKRKVKQLSPQSNAGHAQLVKFHAILAHAHVPPECQQDFTFRTYFLISKMTKPLSEADILFPHLSNNPNLSSTLSSLKRSALSIHNRLTSIISDSEFVDSVSRAYELPLVANERCGSWYIPAEKKVEGVYFKSTDGHMGEWGFSTRRLNFQLLDVVQKYGGAVVADSTRRGKSMPDALSKTIPIWCCVINRVLFATEGQHAMYTPPQAVSSSEHAQISSRIDGFVQEFLVGICRAALFNGRI